MGVRCSARCFVFRSAAAMKFLCFVLSLVFVPWCLPAIAQVAAKSEPPWRTFVSRADSFRFEYPSSLTMCGKGTRKETCLTYIPICDETALACVAHSAARYQGYNFEGAAFSVNKHPDADTNGKCLGSTKLPAQTELIHGVEFQTGHQSSAGMGHGLSEYSYTTFHGGQCYELDIRIATSSLGGDAPGTIKEFTEQEEQREQTFLRKALSTFRFLK